MRHRQDSPLSATQRKLAGPRRSNVTVVRTELGRHEFTTHIYSIDGKSTIPGGDYGYILPHANQLTGAESKALGTVQTFFSGQGYGYILFTAPARDWFSEKLGDYVEFAEFPLT
jgi:hypothetical protein